MVHRDRDAVMYYHPWLDADVQRAQTLYFALSADDGVGIWAKDGACLSAYTSGGGQLFWRDARQLFGGVLF